MVAIGVAVIIAGLVFYLDKINYHIFYGRAIMTVSSSGGMCADGICKSPSYRLYDSGKFEGHQKLSQAEVANLKQLIANTDFTAYGVDPSPSCPSFADGPDRILSFPQKHGNQKFTVCMLDVPSHDLTFSTIEKLIASDRSY